MKKYVNPQIEEISLQTTALCQVVGSPIPTPDYPNPTPGPPTP